MEQRTAWRQYNLAEQSMLDQRREFQCRAERQCSYAQCSDGFYFGIWWGEDRIPGRRGCGGTVERLAIARYLDGAGRVGCSYSRLRGSEFGFRLESIVCGAILRH